MRMRGGAISFAFSSPYLFPKKFTRKPTLTGIAHQRNILNNPILPQTPPQILPRLITVGSLVFNLVFLGSSSYVLIKHALNRLHEFIALENPNITAAVFHPGSVLTFILEDLEDFEPFALDSRTWFSFILERALI